MDSAALKASLILPVEVIKEESEQGDDDNEDVISSLSFE